MNNNICIHSTSFPSKSSPCTCARVFCFKQMYAQQLTIPFNAILCITVIDILFKTLQHIHRSPPGIWLRASPVQQTYNCSCIIFFFYHMSLVDTRCGDTMDAFATSMRQRCQSSTRRINRLFRPVFNIFQPGLQWSASAFTLYCALQNDHGQGVLTGDVAMVMVREVGPWGGSVGSMGWVRVVGPCVSSEHCSVHRLRNLSLRCRTSPE